MSGTRSWRCFPGAAAILWIGVGQAGAAAGVAPGAAIDPAVAAAVREHTQTDSYTLQAIAARPQPDGLVEFEVALEGQPHQVVLRPRTVRAAGFRVRVQDGSGQLHTVMPPPPRTYVGHVVGGGPVVATVRDGTVWVYLSMGDASGQRWVIEPLGHILPDRAGDWHVVYRAADSRAAPGTCATPETVSTTPRSSPQSRDIPPLEGLVVEIACDTDVEFYQLNKSSLDDTVADIEMIISGVSSIYELDAKVAFQITEIIVRTAEPDPYSTTNMSSLLTAVRNDWITNHTDVQRDLVELFTGKDTGTTTGKAYLDTLCYFDHYSVVRSRFSSVLEERILVSAHEIGHNFGCGHCDDIEPWCRIMCSTTDGCSGGLHSFAPLQLNIIRSTAQQRFCLAIGDIDLPRVELPFADDFNYCNASAAPDPNRWTAVDEAACRYKRLNLDIGRGWDSRQQLGTVRTLPMSVHGPATITYQLDDAYIPVGQSMKIEYFNSALWAWQPLETVAAEGSTTYGYSFHKHAVPPDGYGDYFALRFSAYGTQRTSSGSWRVENVAIRPGYAPADFDGDGDVDVNDLGHFQPCAAGPEMPVVDTACLDADLDADGDIDQADFGEFQRCYSGQDVPADCDGTV